jgi:hypothetical protein
MPKFNPPNSFDFTRPQDWPNWKSRFERFCIVTELTEEDENIQLSSLIYAMGLEAENIFKSFVFANDDEKDNYKVVMAKFDSHFVPKRNIIHERTLFHRREQKQGESVEEFIRALYELSENCEFTDKDDQIRDRIVIGIADKTVSEKLQLIENLTLNQAIETARQSEAVKQQLSQQATAHTGITVNAVQTQKKVYPKKSFRTNQNRHSMLIISVADVVNKNMLFINVLPKGKSVINVTN